MALSLPLRFSAHKFVGSALVSFMASATGARMAYLDGTMICLDDEHKFRSAVCPDFWDFFKSLSRSSLSLFRLPRWCVYHAEVFGRGGRLVAYVSIMGAPVEEGGSLVRTAALLKDIRAEAIACDLTAEEIADAHRFMLNGWLVVVKSPAMAAL